MQQVQVDEAKVKALESIFGGQDITASVIRTVLSSSENKFDDAVDSLLNMTTSAEETKPKQTQEAEEESLLDKKERDKIKTLENMFGNDLSNSVICTVLESNKGELVDTVDTLLNMTSKDLGPQFTGKDADNRREAEKARQQEELKNYEEFKRLQIKLQEEEAQELKEQARKNEEETRKRNEEAQRCKAMMEEQERLFREYEANKKIELEKSGKLAEQKVAQEKRLVEEAKRQAEQKAAEERRLVEEYARRVAQEQANKEKEAMLKEKELSLKAAEERRLLREEQERLQRSWEGKLKELQAEEEKIRAAEAKRKQEEENLRRERQKQEELLKAKAMEEEKRIAALKEAETKKLEQKRKELEKELEIADRRRAEEVRMVEQMRMEEEKRRMQAEERAYRQRIEEEEATRLRKLEEERRAAQARMALEADMRELQKQKDALQAMLKAQQVEVARQEEEKRKQEEEKRRQEEEERMQREREERERKEEQERLLREEQETKRLEEALKALKIAEEEKKKQEEEEAARQAEEAKIQEIRRQQEEAEAAAVEKERAKKEQYDLMAASAVFIPPKANQTPDESAVKVTATTADSTVTCTWDLPEGNASPTNWLGLYPVRALFNTNKYTQYLYTNGANTGQHVFRGVTPGHYEVRFFLTRGYEHAARSATVCVGPKANIMPQVQGEHVLVCYTLDPLSSTPSREWLGIYEKTQRRNKVYISTAYGNAEGQVMMKAPRAPGVYEVRLFASGAVYNEQAKAEFSIDDNDCVNVEQGSVMAGANVNISWIIRTVDPTTSDWVGLYRADEQNNNNYLSCTYTQGTSVGTATVQAPKDVGVYEFRMFVRAKGKYVTFRTSQPLSVV